MSDNQILKKIVKNILLTSTSERTNALIKQSITRYLSKSNNSINDEVSNTSMLDASAQAGNLDMLTHLLSLKANAKWGRLLKFARGGYNLEKKKQEVRLRRLTDDLERLNSEFIDNERDFFEVSDIDNEEHEFSGMLYPDYVKMIEDEKRELIDEINYIEQILKKHKDTIEYIDRQETKDAKGVVLVGMNTPNFPADMVYEIMGNVTTNKEKKRPLIDDYSERFTKKKRGGKKKTKKNPRRKRHSRKKK